MTECQTSNTTYPAIIDTMLFNNQVHLRFLASSKQRLLFSSGNYRFLTTISRQTRHKKECNVHASSLLQNSPALIPQVTFAKQLKANLARSFSTGSQLLSYYRQPKNTIYGNNFLGRLWSRIPDSVKLLGLVGVSAYLFVFVALPVFIVVVPPIVIGGWLFYRINRYLRESKMKKIWKSIEDSTLVYYPKISEHTLFVPSPEQINNSLANFEMNRILDAFWNNEKGVNDYFKVTDIDNLALGTLEAVEYSYNSTSVVFADDFSMMVTQQRPLYNKANSQEIANVFLALKCLERPQYEDLDPSANITKSLVQIEIVPTKLFAPTFLFNTTSVSTKYDDKDYDGFDDNGGYINVKGKTRNI